MSDPFTSEVMGGMPDTAPLQRSPGEVVAAVSSTPTWMWWVIGGGAVAIALYFLYRWLTTKAAPAAAPAPPAAAAPAAPAAPQ
jgi:hypothetical protein